MPRFEYTQDSAHKFWEIGLEGLVVTTRWGRIGTNGQSKTKAYATPAAAERDIAKQIGRKTAKGYAKPGSAASLPKEQPPSSGPLEDGDSVRVKGSSSTWYTLQNTGGVFSCSCPAWLHQSVPIEGRTCKHLRAFRGEAAEHERLGDLPAQSKQTRRAKEGAPQVLLAHPWDQRDPKGWWMSEKLDGVRAWWTGERFLSRQGNEFKAPDWFVETLPSHALDGELFGGRRRFQETVSIARRADRGERWRELEYVVFDAPTQGGGFEDRLAHAQSAELGDWARVLSHTVCRGSSHLLKSLKQVEAVGGEGLMLRQPGSLYVAGRSETLLKVKTFHDAEAEVVGHQPGTGKHRGRLGALEVRLPDGTLFKVGTGFSDAERASPPAVGSTITFRYQELTPAGVPRFASFLRECED